MKSLIRKGEYFLCVKDYIMHDKSIAFKQGALYRSDANGCLKSDFSDNHEMEEESDFWEYFKLFENKSKKGTHKDIEAGTYKSNGSILPEGGLLQFGPFIGNKPCTYIPKSKELKIELRDWHHQCSDGCCDSYGTDIYLNGEKLDEQYADDSKNALTAILEKLGYKVDITSY